MPRTDWDSSVLWVDWFDDHKNGGLFATCSQWPAWRFTSDRRDDQAAKASLLHHRNEHTRCEFTAPWHGEVTIA